MRFKEISLKEIYPVLGENNCSPTLCAYLPDNLTEMGRDEQKRPCILICPGGGYSFCSQREAEPIALNYLSSGYNVFVLYYSCAPKTFPTQLREVAAGLDLIHNKSDCWHCDTEKIAIMGFSAGGHLAAHYSNEYDCKEVREVFENSYPVNASVLCYPVITAEKGISHEGSFLCLTGKNEIDENTIERFSCDRMVSEKTPPAFVWHTSEDACVPVQNSLLYTRALADKKIPFELHIYPFGAHGLATADAQTNGDMADKIQITHSWIDESKKWLEIIL